VIATLSLLVTAFCTCVLCTGVWFGHPTSTGTRPVAGRTLACDPKVFPMGTEILIEGVGVRTCETVGGAIKGRHVDLYVRTHHEGIRFGVQEARGRVVWVPTDWTVIGGRVVRVRRLR